MKTKTLGEIIRDARKAKGMTQGELGSLLGITNSAVQKYEKSVVTNIPVNTRMKLAILLGIPPKKLLLDENLRPAKYAAVLATMSMSADQFIKIWLEDMNQREIWPFYDRDGYVILNKAAFSDEEFIKIMKCIESVWNNGSVLNDNK